MKTSKHDSTQSPSLPSIDAGVNAAPYEEAPLEAKMREQPIANPSKSLLPTFEPGEKNVGEIERVVSNLAGGFLTAAGARYLWRKNWLGGIASIVAGAALVKRGSTGQCELYKAMNMDSTKESLGSVISTKWQEASKKLSQFSEANISKGFQVERSVIIESTAVELYQFWRKLENLPQFMTHLKSVTVLPNGQSHWVAKAPIGFEVSWNAVITREEGNHLIAWKSIEASQIDTEGTVTFDELAYEKATKLTVNLTYRPPGGIIGVALAKFFGRDAEAEITEDLDTFKHYMESGVLPSDTVKLKGVEQITKH